MDVKSIGKNIAKYRKAKSIKQEDFAEIAGISTTYLSDLERGRKTPKLETLLRIADCLDVSADALVLNNVKLGEQISANVLWSRIESLSISKRKAILNIVDALISNMQNI
ncbi:MAG: helix-turn-helix transcriptional regulator [Oscillospiraceae bacterium]|nr:helix-turn-helix transcriptional regulator [Oscillospiraceae bacterium]